ncbi:Hypothetical protein GL50581_904 [Giardia duodenalis ATCC 50581]|uniref:Uncharacterized protein n=1 Tax=Giardia intestinalis (strain ATCC 50581 / GS clone H7) TaxID=598745 RepID=C6LQ82_GIAIB|nr:Hypothetical protein GL50581_904 [Giardia intestinalis ATCC 50581]
MRGKPITETEGKDILQELARAVEESHDEHPSIQDLLADPQLLDKYIRQVKIDWHTIAARLRMDKGKVYTWYFNTWSNKTLGPRMSAEDKDIIKTSIRNAIQNNIPIDKEFRKSIYNRLSTTYHTLEVSCHVTNYLNSREAKSLMEECNFYVEKLSKHRGSSSATSMTDASPSHARTPASSTAYSAVPSGTLPDTSRSKKNEYVSSPSLIHGSSIGGQGIVPGTLNMAIGPPSASLLNLGNIGISHAPFPSTMQLLQPGIPAPLSVGLDMTDPLHLKPDSDKFSPHDPTSIGLDHKQFLSDKVSLGYFAPTALSGSGCDAGVGDSDGDGDDEKDAS